MAIYHLSVKTISRSAGRSATAAAAYRAGCTIVDTRTGEIHDYTHKGGVVSSDIHIPENSPSWASERADLWNAAEAAETRKNSTVAREFEIALPAELSADERRELANELAREIVKKHGCAVDVCIHEPNKKGDQQNHHAHILLSTRRLTVDGFGEKTRELDERTSGAIDFWRERFAQLQNAALERAGHSERVDHRTLEAQGIDRAPTVHLGVAATAIERRTGEPSEIRLQHDQRVIEAEQKTAIHTENDLIKNLERAIQFEIKNEETRQSIGLILSMLNEETQQPSSIELMEKLKEQLAGFDATNEDIKETRTAILEAHKRELAAQPAFAGRTSTDLTTLAELRRSFANDAKPESQRMQALERFDKHFSDPANLAELLKPSIDAEKRKNAQTGYDEPSL